MVDITGKASTLRKAIASAVLKLSNPAAMDAVLNRTVPKGDVFEFSRAAGLLACKKTYEVIPDCHPLPIEYTSIRFETEALNINIFVEVHTIYKTGVEVEAMHGASVVALTMYDMLKPLDDGIEISTIKLVSKSGGKKSAKALDVSGLKIGIITCSDRASRNEYEDRSGELIRTKLESLGCNVSEKLVVPDEHEPVRSEIIRMKEGGFNLIILTGGTGLSKRDITPEVVQTVLTREIPGIMEAARNYGQQRTPFAMLSRSVAGFSDDCLVLTFPGSEKAVEEYMNCLFPYVFHCFDMLKGQGH